jgi:hypothetical protein
MRYQTRFESVTQFSADVLARLHAPLEPAGALPPSTDPSAPTGQVIVDRAMSTLGAVANAQHKTSSMRRDYLRALLDLFATLPADFWHLADREDVACLAPEREGRQLAQALGFLHADRMATPNAKRIALEDGLLVAMTPVAVPARSHVCLVVDGVIATGATLIAAIDALADRIKEFHVVCAHSTAAGLWALHRFADARDVSLRVGVAAVSGTLNDHFYATVTGAPELLVLGDVGDTIADVTDAATPGT